MSCPSSSTKDADQIKDYVLNHQGLVKRSLFHWFSTFQKDSTKIRQLFWSLVINKENIFFHYQTKRVYYFNDQDWIAGNFFLSLNKSRFYINSAASKYASKELKLSKGNLKAESHDLVLIQRIKPQEYKVIDIIARTPQLVIGAVYKSEGKWCVNIHSVRISKLILISNPRDFELTEGDLVDVSKPVSHGRQLFSTIKNLVSPPHSSGKIVDELCYRYKIKTDFEPNIIKKSQEITKNQEKNSWFKHRIDLTGSFFVTIDSEDCKDLDDAINVSKDPNGIYTLRVAIADVSNFINIGDIIDVEARERACSNYFANIVHPMLPVNISNNICSLSPDSDKFVIVCEVGFDIKQKKISYSKIYYAKIKSHYQLSYKTVNNLLTSTNPKTNFLYYFLRDCERLSQFIRANILVHQPFNIKRDELRIEVDENNLVRRIKLHKLRNAEEIIEHFMIIANHSVAKFMQKNNINGIYRQHKMIKPENLIQLWAILKTVFQHKIPKLQLQKRGSSNIYSVICENQEFINNNKIALLIVVSCYEPAFYTENYGRHFGIGVSSYCHFTSPIRRYSDLFVHYVLFNYMFSDEIRKFDSKEKINVGTKAIEQIDVGELCFNLNTRMRLSHVIERQFVRIQQAHLLSRQEPNTVYKATITNILSGKMYLDVGIYGGVLQVRDLGREFFREDKQRKMLIGTATKTKYKIGDILNVVPKFINVNLGLVSWSLA